ncbi:MAG: hypothetical protein CM15mP49_21810 [Actinomycetota bacterium]|nr:MAG: hypothetical protein CM15mP49_21810 [Actinomycetota bacterium]
MGNEEALQPGEARQEGPSLRDEASCRPQHLPPPPLLEESYEFLGDHDLPYESYISPEFASSEYDKLWSKVWQWACHVLIIFLNQVTITYTT